jgi:hypothetical protein
MHLIKGKGASNVQYGLQTEDKAFKAFCAMYNIDVIKSGLIVHICRPWISASPDGLILTNGQISSVLEIKCPSSCKQKPIIDESIGKSNLSYIEIKNGEIKLKPSHIYYTQIQMLLYCTGLNDCNLFIFNEIKPLLLIIKKDSTFLKSIIPKLDFPSEFNRLPRSLDELEFFKATEFRSFLLYTSLIVLKGRLTKQLFKHFMLLHCAIKILISNDLYTTHNTIAKNLLVSFVSL